MAIANAGNAPSVRGKKGKSTLKKGRGEGFEAGQRTPSGKGCHHRGKTSIIPLRRERGGVPARQELKSAGKKEMYYNTREKKRMGGVLKSQMALWDPAN